MDPLKRNRIASTDVEITQLGFGAGSLGDPFEITSEGQADATVAAAVSKGMNYFDTAPWYGNTKSEHRLGRNLWDLPRDSYILNTKVGRIYSRPDSPKEFDESPWMRRWKGGLPFDLRFDFTRDGLIRSYEDSLQRLGINTVDCLTIHDLDLRHQKSEEGVSACLDDLEKGGGYQALKDLKEGGEIKAIGAGINHVGMIPRFLERFEIDFFLVAMPYTLMDQDALDDEFPLCEERGVSVIIGAAFCSGILAKGISDDATYAYQPADEKVVERVRGIQAVCDRHGIPMGAAALQFPLGHPVVSSVIPGPNSPEQVNQNWDWMRVAIPPDFWSDLKSQGLLRADAPVPD